jgi:hypothetical protein
LHCGSRWEGKLGWLLQARAPLVQSGRHSVIAHMPDKMGIRGNKRVCSRTAGGERAFRCSHARTSRMSPLSPHLPEHAAFPFHLSRCNMCVCSRSPLAESRYTTSSAMVLLEAWTAVWTVVHSEDGQFAIWGAVAHVWGSITHLGGRRNHAP